MHSEHTDIVYEVKPVTPNFAVYRSAESNGAVIYEGSTWMLVLSSKQQQMQRMPL